jgi:hypothetical protein
MNALFLSIRVLHVLLGAAWLGAAVLLSFFLMPAVTDAGPDGGKVVIALIGRRLDAYIASIAGLTVLTGLYLYWTVTGGFDPATSATMKGRVLGLGGVLGLAAAIIGGSVVSRNMKKAVALMTQASGATDAGGRSALLAEAAQCRQKAATGGRIVAVLLIVIIVLMVVGGHFA